MSCATRPCEMSARMQEGPHANTRTRHVDKVQTQEGPHAHALHLTHRTRSVDTVHTHASTHAHGNAPTHAVSIESGFRVQGTQGSGFRARRHLQGGPGGVSEWAKQIEGSLDAQLLPHRRHILHRRVILLCENETEATRLHCSRHLQPRHTTHKQMHSHNASARLRDRVTTSNHNQLPAP